MKWNGISYLYFDVFGWFAVMLPNYDTDTDRVNQSKTDGIANLISFRVKEKKSLKSVKIWEPDVEKVWVYSQIVEIRAEIFYKQKY